MTSAQYIHLCQVIKPVLYLARWFGIYPGHQCAKIKNHNDLICDFYPSRRWIILSFLNQIFFIPFVLLTTLHSIYSKYSDGVLWFANVVNVIVHEIELYTILICGIVHAKSISRILNNLSAIPSCPNDSIRVMRYLKMISLILMLMFAIMSATYIGAIWFKRNSIAIFSLTDIFDSAIGLLMRNYLLIFTQIQCIYIVMISSIFVLKYDYLTSNVQNTIEKLVNSNVQDIIQIKLHNGFIIDDSTKPNLITQNLTNLNTQFHKINDCLCEINKCIGFQLLVTLTTDLYTLIFFIFRGIHITKYHMSIFTGINSLIGSVILGAKLILYMYAGYNIKTKSRKPLAVLQRSNILRLPHRLQQQIQTLMIQWSTADPGSLSAFYLMDVGPWLLAPIVGNVITYLLVFIQNDMG